MGGLIFMVKEKMCVGVIKDELMIRIDPERRDELLAMSGCRPMSFKDRRSKGFVLVEASAVRTQSALDFWLDVGLSFNRRARSSGRKKAAGHRPRRPSG